MVNQKVLPAPVPLVTPICPPINSTSFLEMANPKPVPPNLRVVEASAWTDSEKSALTTSG